MIKSVRLNNFKKHYNLELCFHQNLNLFYGDNGVGKTSILEAISLFTSGKGIFNLNPAQLINQKSDYWKVQIETDDGVFQISYQHNKKNITFNNTIITSNVLLEHFTILGLTPYTSLAFWQDAALRRKIIDRIILQQNPIYGTVYKKYLDSLKQRNLLIKNETFNSHWSSILDPIIQENGLKINQIRKKIVPQILSNRKEQIVEFLQEELELEISPNFKEQEKILNSPINQAFIGPHLSRFSLKGSKTIYPSTGQQRKLLIALNLISMNLNPHKTNILLLDDFLSSLDENTINEVIDLLKNEKSQVFFTHINQSKNANLISKLIK